MSYLRVDPPRAVHITFDVNGLFTHTVHDPEQSWHDRFLQCLETLIALPEATDLGFVQNARKFYSGWNGKLAPPALPGTLEAHLRYNPHLRTQFVPDARGAMLLTNAHLERAHDLRDWSIEPLGDGRHLVQAHDLAAWYAQAEPSPEVLQKARADFGTMILTLADIERYPPPSAGTRPR